MISLPRRVMVPGGRARKGGGSRRQRRGNREGIWEAREKQGNMGRSRVKTGTEGKERRDTKKHKR